MIGDKSSGHTCLKHALSVTISFVLPTVSKSSHPKSMLFLVEERLDAIKYNIDFGGKGGGTKGEGIGMSTIKTLGPFYRSVSTLLSLIVAIEPGK